MPAAPTLRAGRRDPLPPTKEAVATFHDVQLVDHVGQAIDRYRAGDLDASDMDQVMFQYSRAAKELWEFCNLANVEVVPHAVRNQPPRDWWERRAPRRP